MSKFLMAVAVVTAVFGSSCRSLMTGTEAAPPAQEQAPPAPVVVNGMRTSYADVVEKTSPAVVQIRMERKETERQSGVQGLPFPFPFGQPNQGQPQQQRPQIERGAGSGVIVAADGTILTNNHVVEDADKITVLTSDNKTFQAKIIGTDKLSDLAVIKVEAQNLPFLSLGNSDQVRVGDIVLAIGNPLDIGETVTAGIISAKGRRTGISDGSFEDFLQTDAPINRGNSGGALVNLNGELIGINSQILSPGGAQGGNIGIGFSIPSNMAKSVMDQLVKDGKVRRGMLGINIQNITDDMAAAGELSTASGIIVSGVKTGSAADKAGIKRGDIITAINGEKLDDSNALRNKVASTAPGTSISISVTRNGKEEQISATLDEYDQGDAKSGPASKDGGKDDGDKGAKLGVTLEPVTPQIAKQLGLDDAEGLVVSEIDPNGAAASAGLSRGDVILEVNRKAVSSVADVKSALEGVKDKPVLLLVSRRGQTSYVTVRPE